MSWGWHFWQCLPLGLPSFKVGKINRRHGYDLTSLIVYPSDRDASTITWADATSKARANVAQMTLEEMNDLVVAETLTGTDYGLYGSKNKFGFPGYLPSDGPAGVRNLDLVNAFPAGASIAASWNTGLANQRGNFMGAEFRAKVSRTSSNHPYASREVSPPTHDTRDVSPARKASCCI